MLNLGASALVTLLVPFSAAVLAQERNVDVKSAIAVLQEGSLLDREATMGRVVASGAIKESPALAKAISAELIRMIAVVTDPQRRMLAGVAELPPIDIGEYMGLLVEACAQSTDPLVIDGLLGAIDTGNMATRALARFGPVAFDRVLTIAERGIDEMKVMGALRTLDQMDQINALLPAHRSRTFDVIRARLSGRQSFIVFRQAIELAASSGQPDLRQRVEAIASGIEVPDLVDRREMLTDLQRAARTALDKKRK